MIPGITKDDFMDWNYDFLRIHRVIPKLTKSKRPTFKLADLQVADLSANPGFGRSILATLLTRMYDALWITIDNPKDLLVDPAEETLDDLATHCHTTAALKHPGSLSAMEEGK